MSRMFAGPMQGGAAIVDPFVPGTGDGVILHPREAAHRRVREIGLHVIEVEVVTHVAVKVAISPVPGITFLFAPDLAGGIEVAPEGGDAIGREHRRIDAITRTRAR